MLVRFLGILFVAFLVRTAAAQPVINAGGIVNAASFVPGGLPNGAIAPGSLFTIFGQNLGPAQGVQSSLPLPTTSGLGGTTVQIAAGGRTLSAIMMYASAAQVSAILPSSTPLGAALVSVTYHGQTSASRPISVVQTSFGSFSRAMSGSGPAVLQNFVSPGSSPLNAVNQPARPGQIVTLWGTGLGPVAGDEAAGPLPSVPVQNSGVQVLVGGRPAHITYQGRSGCCAGVDQINFQVSSDTVQGCYIPIQVLAGGVTSNSTTMAISSGSLCSDPLGISSADLTTAQTTGSVRIAAVALNRTELGAPGSTKPPVRLDTANLTFGQWDLAKLVLSRGISGAPSLGTCTVYTFLGSQYQVADPVTPTLLDGGQMALTGPSGTMQIPRPSAPPAVSTITLGGGDQPNYLETGTYRVTNTTGLSATLKLPQPPVWTNQSSTISRSRNLTVSWSGGDTTQFAQVIGYSVRGNPQAGAAFVCTAPAAVGSLNVPSFILSTLPDSDMLSASVPNGTLLVGLAPLLGAARTQAPGFDAVYFYYTVLSGGTVMYTP